MNPGVMVLWQRHGLSAMLGVVAVLCVVAIGIETGWGRAIRLPLPVAANATQPADSLATLPPYALPSLETAFPESGDRPLFTPTRRPSAVSLAGNVPAMRKGQFKLSGTSINNDLTVAYLVETTSGKTVRVTKGKDINGITLDTVEPNRVVLKQGTETEELTLRTAASPPAPPATPAPAVSQPGSAPAAPGVAAVQPVTATAASVSAPPALPPRPNLPAPNPLAPAPGSSQLPGFVMPSAALPPPTQAAPAADNANTAQRRRRFQTAAPQ